MRRLYISEVVLISTGTLEEMKSPRELFLVLLETFAIIHLVQAQMDQQEFISLDCGFPIDLSPYTESSTKLTYVSDDDFVRSGESGRVNSDFSTNFLKPYKTLRYFPNGTRNCYNLHVSKDRTYLIRAVFVYGNYDGLNEYPTFDLYLGPNKWRTIELAGRANGTREEIIHTSESNSLQVCLVRTGKTAPIISALELRPLRNITYISQSGSLSNIFRVYLSNSGRRIRYPDDDYDRQWFPFFTSDWTQINTTFDIDGINGYNLPQVVLATAATPKNASAPVAVSFTLDHSDDEIYLYIHFAEIDTVGGNATREFNISWNGDILFPNMDLDKLQLTTVYTPSPLRCDGGLCVLEFVKTKGSTLPPLVNAIEAYAVIPTSQLETNESDVLALTSVRDTYGITAISWQGDPCVPNQFMWDGLNCSNTDVSTPPYVITLNLSSKGLSGIIAPSIWNLTHLQELDLSDNNLTGGVPKFLASMKSLMVINLSNNHLSGSVPKALLDRKKKGLKLNVKGNPKLCASVFCTKEVIVTLVAVGVSVAVIIVSVVLFFVYRKKRSPRPQASSTSPSQSLIETKKRRFTYSEVAAMTNNFGRVLGNGGFGMVYHGYVNETEEVAVKVIYGSSAHGYRQFKEEVELLLRVHHINLVSLVGYCDEREHLALIYEYMANGDLKEHLSGNRSGSALTWTRRLKIAVDAGIGLEYLHTRCRPQTVHRDVKSTNILLDQHFQAKLGDFGLSRSFPVGGETNYVSTVVAGTPGYLDPEYYRTNWLTEKSDVYSFGIVLMEIFINRPVIDQTREKAHITEWVELMLTKGDIEDVIDPDLVGDHDLDVISKVLELARACANPSSAERPNMTQVVRTLNECDRSRSKSSYQTANSWTEVNPVAG